MELKYIERVHPEACPNDSPLTSLSVIYGSVAFARSLCQDILDDLRAVMPLEDAERAASIALLRDCFPGIASNRYATNCKRSYVSVYFPGVALGENTVSAFLQHLGEDCHIQQAFYDRRISRVCEKHRIAIDGTLKQDSSTCSTLSQYSRNHYKRIGRDISVIYAYNMDLNEPVCGRVFAGSCLDAKAYSTFIQANNIRDGILIADKGFPVRKINQQLSSNHKLHYISPLKRNDRRIAANNMLDFGPDVLKGIDDIVYYKKTALNSG